MGGKDYCAVYGCDHSRSRQMKPCGYYEFPKQPQAKSHWIAATGRQDINCKTIGNFAKVCGCHFLSGKPNRKDRNNVDVVPTLQIPKSVSQKNPRPSRTSAKTTEWTEAVNSAEKLHRNAAAIPRKSRRRLNIDEIPTVRNEVEIVEEIDTEKLADVAVGGVPEDQIEFDGDHNYTHRRVLELEPRNHSSTECQTDKTECQDSASQTADGSDFLRVKVKQYEHYIAKLKAQLKENEKSVMAFNHHMIKDDSFFGQGCQTKVCSWLCMGFFEPKAKTLNCSRTVGGGAPRYSHSASSGRKTGKENTFFD